MDEKEQLKKAVVDRIDELSEKIYDIGDTLMGTPELGFKEYKTSDTVYNILKEEMDETERGIAITGVRSKLRGRKHKACVCIMGELDAVSCPSHPQADIVTGAAHACGHNIQLANMLACALALKHSGVMNFLDGDVSFLATPAEEFIDLTFRNELKKSGKIELLSGKQEMIHLGIFNDIDAVMMVHSQPKCPENKIFINGDGTGFIVRTVLFKGKEAHAGGAPWDGINALNAANAAIMMINCLRETFRDEDKTRVHYIITKGGDSANTVPADVRMELYVRGSSERAMQEVSEKVERAIRGAAYGIGAEVEIIADGTYLPLHQNEALGKIFAENARGLVDEICYGVDMIGSTDVGNLCKVLPTIQPTIGGFSGGAHSKDFHTVNKYLTYIVPAKIMAETAIDLLYNNAEELLKIREGFKCGQKKN